MSDREDYEAALERYPVLRQFAGDPEDVVRRAQQLDSMPLGTSLGFQREYALYGAVLAARSAEERLEWERDIARLESRVRPVDLPPGRDRAAAKSELTEEEMHTPIEELIARGRWEPTLMRPDLP